MNIFQFLAIAMVVLVSISQSVSGHKKPYPGKKTTLAPTPSPTPTVAELETTSIPTTKRRPYPGKKTKPTPSPAALETTMKSETTQASIETTMKSIETTTKPVKSKTPAPTLPPVDFDCSKQEDGYYADPKDKCSGKFYACVGGLARQMECSVLGLVFEPETGRCENRRDSYRCTGTRKTTLATTPRAPPPPPAKLIIDCTQMDDGWYPDPENKCSHRFFSCSNGKADRFDCPGNMYFDVDTTRCQAYQDVVACAGKKPPTTKKPIVTTEKRVTEKLPIDCMEKPSGQYVDPLNKCSSTYYVCSNGDAIKRSCPDGLYYSPKSKLCDYYDEIFECTGRTKPPTKPTPKPVPSESSLPNTEYDCSKKADGSYTPEDKKCSEIYYRCVGGVTYKLTCPEGLYYDMKNDLCDRWANLFVCCGKEPTTPKPITTVKPKPTEKSPIDCSSYDDGDFADPKNKCSSVYYSCTSGVGTRRHCPKGLFFDKDLTLCDMRNNVPDCTGKPRPATTTPRPTKRPDVTKAPFDCDQRGDGNYESGKCKEFFWSCVGGSAIKGSCPHGTFYDKEMNECGYKEQIPACGGVRPTASP